MATTAEATEIRPVEPPETNGGSGVGEEKLDFARLEEMTRKLQVDDCMIPDASDLPRVKSMAAAVFRQHRLIEMCHSALREVLEAMDFSFDWSRDDLAVERGVGFVELDRAGELLEELHEGLYRWLRCVGRTRLVELDDETMRAVDKLRPGIPEYRRHDMRLFVKAAMQHLAEDPAATAIIAACDQARCLAGGPLLGQTGVDKHRGWPWTDRDGRPWGAPEDATSAPSRREPDAGDSEDENTARHKIAGSTD